MKLISKITFVLIIVIVLSSCNKEEMISSSDFSAVDNIANRISKNEFDFSVYENKESLFKILKSMDFDQIKLNEAIKEINSAYGTNIYETDFDQYLKDHPYSNIEDYYKMGFINHEEFEMINSFFNDLDIFDFDQSLKRLQEKILNLNYSSEEFEKYNLLVNNLLIVNEYYGKDKNDDGMVQARMSAGCAAAIASNGIATVTLSSCAVPGPWCGLAIVGKALSMAGVYLSCT